MLRLLQSLRFRALALSALLFSLMASTFIVLAQGEEPAPPGLETLDWLKYAMLIVNAVLVPLATDVVKVLWARAPGVVKQIVPLFIGAALAAAEAWIAARFGFDVDLSGIGQVILGAGGGIASSFAFARGDAHGSTK